MFSISRGTLKYLSTLALKTLEAKTPDDREAELLAHIEKLEAKELDQKIKIEELSKTPSEDEIEHVAQDYMESVTWSDPDASDNFKAGVAWALRWGK